MIHKTFVILNIGSFIKSFLLSLALLCFKTCNLGFYHVLYVRIDSFSSNLNVYIHSRECQVQLGFFHFHYNFLFQLDYTNASAITTKENV